MKKLFAILTCALMCIALFTACDLFEHKHTYGAWIAGEDGHFQPYTCGCPQAEVYLIHNYSEEGICELCGYKAQFIFKLNYEETGYELDRVGPAYIGGDVVIPSEYRGLPVVEIGYSAFESECKLTSVIIPDTVTLISDDAFENQTDLTSVDVGNGVVTIGVSAFEGCTSLKTVVISDATENIYAHAFDRCTSLESITLGKNVKKIGGSAFEECTSLKVITIPASVEELGAWVFYDTNMTDIYFGVSAPGEKWSEKWNQYLDESVNIHWETSTN